ncbi:(S)-beta-bisabolene synthase [Elysia marginata]|uniref:(S)-beta-bisabolene synthase n=1 Tax=Elysia marginata TaxID=1093978 RepID=A0AAV4JY60_9GAST|nr:(S)-beta-bisabolene synthase [Elysia marginata]
MSEEADRPRRSVRKVTVVLKSPSKGKKSTLDYVKKFRAKIAEDPEVHKVRQDVVNKQSRAFYNGMTPEQREKDRKKMQREAQKVGSAAVAALKPTTRKEAQEQGERRAKMAAYMREYRKNLSRQKKAAINKGRMVRYYMSKPNLTSPASVKDQATGNDVGAEQSLGDLRATGECPTPPTTALATPPLPSSPWTTGLTAVIQSAVQAGLSVAASPGSAGKEHVDGLAAAIQSAVVAGLAKLGSPSEAKSNLPAEADSEPANQLSSPPPAAPSPPPKLPEVSVGPVASCTMGTVGRFAKKFAEGVLGKKPSTPAPKASWSGLDNIISDTGTHDTEPEKLKRSTTKGALKKARQRVRKILGGGERAALLLKGLIKIADKNSKEHFQKLNISAKTPEKQTPPPKNRVRVKTARQLFNKPKSKGAAIIKFYIERSIPLPHKRTVSKKTQTEKRVLDVPVKKLFKEFVEQHPTIKISKSTFYRHRPKHILLHSKFPLFTCLCDICQNVQLKLKILNNYLPSSLRMADKWDLYNNLLCSNTNGNVSFNCISMHCNQCGPESLRDKIFSNSALEGLKSKFVVWRKWETVEEEGKKRKALQEVTGSISRLVNDLVWDCRETKFTSHVFTAKWQKDQFSMICNNFPSASAVVVIDFAENYRCLVQGEIQSAYYSYKQVTVHPCVSYYNCDTCGERVNDYSIFVSDDVKHDAHFSQRCQENVISFLKAKGINKVFIFSDGASSQYKSKVPFAFLTKLSKQVDIERCFFGSRHGKNPCDAAGGIVKSCAENAVKCGHAHIQSASDFFDYCSKALALTASCKSHVNRRFYLIENINRSVDIPQFSTLPGTRKLHSIKHISETVFVTRNLSCFCDACLSSSAPITNCQNSNYVNEWETVRLKDGRDNDGSCFGGDDTLNRAFVAGAEDDSVAVLPFLSFVDRIAFFKNLQEHLVNCSTFTELTRLCKTVLPHLERFTLEPQSVYVGDCDAVVDVHACSLRPDAFLPLFPIETTGDGNCMPRAVSRACFCVEDYHCELRCRIVFDMCFHKEHYLSFLPQNDIMQIALLSPCSEGFNLFDFDHLSDIYEAEVLYTSTLTHTLGLWQMSAFASVTGCKIVSVYPSLGPPQYRKLFDQCLKPRVQRRADVLTLMWTSDRQDMKPEYWVANHVVPLLPLGNLTVVWDD